jgi:hypothetical protein
MEELGNIVKIAKSKALKRTRHGLKTPNILLKKEKKEGRGKRKRKKK